jgi:DNA-3-methyladenine glycosylase
MKKLPVQFYDRPNVVTIARELIGKIIVTKFDEVTTLGRIVETEAYIGLKDRASHSYGGRRTARNEHMYAAAGTAYVYICYGMHHLFNVVTNKKEIPDAILIRALEPIKGIEQMLRRTGKKTFDNSLTKGPGNAAKDHSGLNLLKNKIFITEDDYEVNDKLIGISRRIGVESSGEAALLPYRFYIKGNPFVSSYPNK